MSDEVRVELRDRVCVITIDRPHTRNAIGLRTMAELDAALVEICGGDAAVVVITGAGDRAFVSGGDLRELEEIRTVEDAERMARRMRSVLDRLTRLPMPVIAALNGHALGGGAEIAVAADLRIAADDIRIGFTQSTLGFMPAWGGAERLTAMVGRSQALLLLCSGQALEASQAREIGLVDRVILRPDFGAGWREIAARFASLPASATRSIKGVVAAVSPATFPATEAGSVRAFAELWAAPEHWEMAAAAELRRRR
jgi:enoyl-CoA hydratase/carnithine racemase